MPMPIGAKNPSGFVDDARLDALRNLFIRIGGSGASSAVNTSDQVGEGSTGGDMLPVSTRVRNSAASGAQLRTPDTFKSATATAAGNTTIWTPAAGKKFRLMRYRIILRADSILAVAGSNVINLNDNGTAFGVTYEPWIPAAAGTNNSLFDTGWVDLGNGILSATINNPLQVGITTALTGGNVRVLTAGTEE